MFKKKSPFKILKLILKYFTNSCWMINSLIAAFCPNKSCFNKSMFLVEKVSLHEYNQQCSRLLKYTWLPCNKLFFFFFFPHVPLNIFGLAFSFRILIIDLCTGIVPWTFSSFSQIDPASFLTYQCHTEKVIHTYTDTNFPALPRRKLFLHFCFPLCSKYKIQSCSCSFL